MNPISTIISKKQHFRVLFRERGYKVEMANRVGKFHTNVAAVAGSCDCVQLGVWATSWENSAPTLWPLPDHVIMFNWGLGNVVGEFRTNVAAIAGSCDYVQLGFG